MDFSKITITFGEDCVNDNFVSFKRKVINGDGSYILLIETFKPIRTQNYELNTPQSTNNDGSASALEFANYFNIDYNIGGVYEVNVVNSVTGIFNTVEIKCKTDKWEFFEFFRYDLFITATITNYIPTTFALVSAIESANTDICNYYDLSITATEPIKSVSVNGLITTVDTPNSLKEVTLIRGISQVVKIIDVNDVEVLVGTYYYDFLAEENIYVSIYTQQIGATIEVDVLNANSLNLEYSLDNVNWFANSSFTGQPLGIGTMYVRDQFGCLKSKSYEVTSTGTINPYLEISKANSIPFVIREVIDNIDTFENDENSLGFEDRNIINYCDDMVLFNTTDKPTTIQIKSNFENIDVVLRKDDLTETPIVVTKLTSNLNRFTSMDAIIDRYSENKTRIYFESGNIYDEAGDVIKPYTLAGNLPDFALLGEFVDIEGIGTRRILDVFYDNSIGKRVIIVEYNYTDTEPSVVKVSSTYNILPFECYRFTIDWSLLDEAIYDIVITNTDTINGTVIHQSENIDLKTKHNQTLGIRYFNNNNRDIFYKFGQENFIRVPFVDYGTKSKQESVINLQDNSASVIDSDVRFIKNFEFDARSRLMAEQLIIALSSKFVYINDIGYIKDSDIDIEKIGFTNMYSVKADMLKTNKNYSTKYGNSYSGSDYPALGDSGELTDNSITNIPEIITDGTNFIKS
jgi:hypothetical protein